MLVPLVISAHQEQVLLELVLLAHPVPAYNLIGMTVYAQLDSTSVEVVRLVM